MNFNNLIGNDKIKDMLKNNIINNNLVHSYMFIGPDGIGKSIFAHDFAEMVMCLSQTNEGKSCGKCKSCIEFETMNNPDFLQINSDGKVIKIEQIRHLQEKVIEKPIISSKKVYIINDADLMTKEAQNCLLKTLEEPPEYVVIILIVTNESNILPTIKSRCMKIGFNKIDKNNFVNYIEANSDNVKLNENILTMCDGSIGKWLKIKDKLEDYSKIENIISQIEKTDKLEVLKNAEILYKGKENIMEYLEFINVVLYNSFLNNKNQKYINSVELVEKTRKNLLANSNYDMSIDNLLLKIWEEINEEYSWC